MRLFKKALLVGSALLYPLLAFGEDATDSMGGGDKTYVLQKSVVSASGFEQEIKDAPASISVISNKELQEVDYHDLAEALFNMPGVDIGTGQGKSGGYEISIRGMPAIYTLYLVDGLRQNVAGDVGTQNYGWAHALNVFMPPRVAIDHIELIRGPMSTLYGSDAIGGVVNIIMKKPNMKEYEAALEFQTTLQENKQFSDYYGVNFYGSGPIIKDKLALQIRGNYIYRTPSDVNFSYIDIDNVKKTAQPGYIGNPSEGNIYNIGLRLAYAMDEANYFYFDFANGYQNYDNRKKQLGDFSSSPKFYINYRFNYVLAHLGSYNWGQIKTTLQYNNTVNLGRVVPYQNSFTDDSHENRNIAGNDMILQSQATIPLYTNSWFADTLTFGVQYWLQTFHDNPYGSNPYPVSENVTWDTTNPKKPKVNSRTPVDTNLNHYASSGINSLNNQGAIYVENEAIFLDNIILTLGARYTYDQHFKNNISPRAYLVYTPIDWFQLRGGVSTAYRQPYVSELVNGAYGYGAQGGAPFIGNPNLKPETSISYEGGFALDFSAVDFSAMYFRNDYDNKINRADLFVGDGKCFATHVAGHPTNESPISKKAGCSTLENVDKAYTQGVELVFSVKPIFGFHLDANYTFTDSKQLTGKSKGNPVTNTPQHQANVSVGYTILEKADVYLQGVYKSERYRNAGKNESEIAKVWGDYLAKWYKPYYAINLGVNYQINKNFRVSFGIQNLLGTNFIDYRAYGRNDEGKDSIINLWNASYEGRRYFLTLSSKF